MNKKGFLGSFIALVAVIVTIVIFSISLPIINYFIVSTLPFLASSPVASFVVRAFPFMLLLFIVYRGLQLVMGGVRA